MGKQIISARSVEEAAKILTSAHHGRTNTDDPFWIFDLGDVANKSRTWKELMPRIRPYYAMKAAPHRSLIKYLLIQGAGIDCASQEEIDVALELGAKPNDIVLSNAIKQISHLEHAKRRNVNLTVFDCKEELHKIKKHHPKSEVLLRIETHGKEAAINLSSRFGANLEESKHLIKLSKELEMKLVGICFHVGSGCYNTSAYARALKDSKELFDFAETMDLSFKVLDIGGGFPGIEDAVPSFEEFAHTINESLERLFPTDQYPNLQVIAEPGKYFASGSFTLVTSVIGKRVSDDISRITTYTVNDGIFGSLTLVPQGYISHGECEPYLLADKEDKQRQHHKCRICGPTCSGLDVICYEKVLPELEIGDWLIWKNCGSYTFSVASNFNGFKQGPIYEIISGDAGKKLLDENTLRNVMSELQSSKEVEE